MNHDYNRRTLITATGATLAGATFAGCLGGSNLGANASSGESSTTTTQTDVDATISVGSGGNFTFDPYELTVRPAATIEWVWESDTHNVVPESQPSGANWKGTPGGESKTYDSGYTYQHTFTTEGHYEYYCTPHKSAGMVAGFTVSRTKPTATTTENQTTSKPATEKDLPIEVGPEGNLVFSPGTNRPLKIPAGTEVSFVWKSDSHNIVVAAQPDGANWEGTPGPKTKTYDAGYTYTHTFDVPGKYEFFCQPHHVADTWGTILVE